MRSSRRFLALLGLLLTLALSLSGCVHMDRGVKLNGDGTGTYTLTIGFSEQLVSLGGDQFAQKMNSFGDKVKKEGGSYRHFDDTGYSVWEYTRPFDSVTKLNSLFTDLPQTGDSSTSTTTSTSTDSFSVSEDSGPLTNTFHVTGKMSMAIPQGSTSGLDPNTQNLLKDARESFAVTMPGWVTSHDGGTVDGNTVKYTIHFGEQATIDVVGGGVNTTVVVPAGIGAGVVVLLGIALIVFGVSRRRRAANPEPAMTAVTAVTASSGSAGMPTPPMGERQYPSAPAQPQQPTQPPT
jgi:hypothetical protein